jgi:hypothetical protein
VAFQPLQDDENPMRTIFMKTLVAGHPKKSE